ncbi:MAG: response regulator, partial [Spirochaetes bacterium]|nr:response regulator [Spirochaetota bacterium]
LNDLIKEIVDLQRFTLEKESIECKLKLGKVPEIFVDSRQIKEVLLNLITHARSAIKPNKKGTITIQTSFNRDAVMLKLVNDGVPVNWENGEEQKAKGSNGVDSVGNGINLAIAYGIMQSHGGDMTLCHDPARCNEVTLYFKRFNPAFDAVEKKEDKEMLYLGEVRILIVDDEEPIRQFLSSAFERMGYQVLTTDNGQEAIEICTFEDIDIVFLDYLMPGYKGDAVFKSIHEVSPQTDVVFITGVDSIPDIDKLLMMGLEGVLRKPFKIETIIKLTNEIMARRYNTLQD